MRQVFSLLAVGILVLIGIVLVFGFVITRESVEVPHIARAASQSSPIVVTHTFPFEDAFVTLILPVDAALYYGAKSTDKSVAIRGNVSERVWVSDSYRAMINDSAQTGFYNGITGEFSRMRQEQHLTENEYVELLMAYVQSLKYVNKPNNPAKFPVETAVDQSGDCDDKSLLLAGLLAHEGYKVALLVFDPESHMAVGIGSTDAAYKNTGYAYIEMTNFSFAGIPPESLQGGIVLRSDPLVIPIGTGIKVYTSGKETVYINDAVTLADQRARDLVAQISALDTELTEKKNRISSIEAQMLQQKSSGNTAAYNAQVPAHNALVSEYNVRLSTYHSLVSQYNKYADLHNYVLDHAYDRKGMYEYVKKQMPASQYGAVLV